MKDDLPVLKRKDVKHLIYFSHPFAFSVRGFSEATGFSRSTVYNMVRDGSVRAHKYGEKIVILYDEGKDDLEKLPDYSVNET